MGRTAILWLAANCCLSAQVTVRGRVISDAGGQAIGSARATLTSPALEAARSERSNAQGIFQLSVPAGHYRLECSAAGYESITWDEFEVTGTSPLDLGDISLTKPRVISGAVRWSDGEPAVGVLVLPLRVLGGRASLDVGRVPHPMPTSEDGSFRIEGLLPGRYVLFAHRSGGAGLAPRVSRPVFFPGSDRPNVAGAIDLRATASAAGLSVTMEEARGVSVEGVVKPSAGIASGRDVSVILHPAGSMLPLAAARTKAGEAFRIDNVPPGPYILLSTTPRLEAAFVQELTVGATPIAGLDISLQNVVPVSGQIEVETPEGRQPGRGYQLVGIDTRIGAYGRTMLRSAADGRFKSPPVFPDEPYELRFDPAPADAYVASLRQGDRDLMLRGVSMIAGPAPVQVLLKPDGGTVTGRVTGKGRAFVVLAPRNRDLVHHYRTAMSRGDGYQLTAIAPGEYDLFAFDRNDDDGYLEPGYLDKHQPRAVRVTVASRAELSRELAVIRLGPD